MTKYHKRHRIIATFFLLIFFPTLLPNNLFASNNGPKSPEAASFEPVDATDMVNLITGQYSYVLPLLNVPSPEGGYPLALSYHAGIGLEQEASWTGLGWNVNPGTIDRSINGYPDDYNASHLNEYFYDQGGEEYASFASIGYSCGAASVGIGFNWGSNQSLGGYVSVGVGFDVGAASVGVNARVGSSGAAIGVGVQFAGLTVGVEADTNGNESISAGYSSNGMGFKISSNGDYSISKGGIGIGGSFSSGAMSINALGFTLSSDGNAVSVSVAGIGYSSSFNNTFQMRDYNNTQDDNAAGIIVPTPIGIFSLTFGKQSFKYWLAKNEDNYVTGPLYFQNGINDVVKKVIRCRLNDCFPTTINVGKAFMDINEATITNNDFDSKTDVVNNNLCLPNYDSYNIQAQGFSGTMSSPIYENGVLSGLSKKENELNYKLDYTINGGTTLIPDYAKFDSKPNFYIESEINSNLTVNPAIFNTNISNSDILNHYNNGVEANSKPRKYNSTFVEYYTNEEIITNYNNIKQNGYLQETNSNLDRSILPKESIGAFKVTTIDGKTYHYSLPVYNHEIITRTFGIIQQRSQEEQSYFEKRQLEPFATHWLLTAVTGPDYVDNGDGVAGEGDLGYWTSFEYGKWTDAFIWKAPYKKDYIIDDTNPNIKTWIRGRKQLYYLDKIKTRTHTALFVKSERTDSPSESWTYKSVTHKNYTASSYTDKFTVPSQKQLRLDKIILLKNSDDLSNKSYGSDLNQSTTILYAESDKESQVAKYNSKDNILDIDDNWLSCIPKAIKVIDLNYDYSLVPGDSRLTLRNVNFKGKGAANILPPYKFDYINDTNTFNVDKKDGWGYPLNNPELFSLNKITTPQGGTINVTYESNKFISIVPQKLNFSSDNSAYFTADAINKTISIGNSNSYPIQVGQIVDINYVQKIYGQNQITTKKYNGPGHISAILAGTNNYQIVFDGNITQTTFPGGIGTNSNTLNVSLILNSLPYIGGGPHVSSIMTSDGANNYITDYKYGQNEDGIGYVTYVPYAQNVAKEVSYSAELPAPRVMHEYVTLSSHKNDLPYESKIRYKFNVMKNKESNKVKYGNFYEIIENKQPNFINSLDKEVSISSFIVKDNLASIGQLLEVITFNKQGQQLSKISNSYYDMTNNILNMGINQESYQTYKTVDYTNNSATVKDKWIINSSTKIKYPNIIKSSTEYKNGYSYTTDFLDYDIISGLSKETRSVSSDGQSLRTRNIPAYIKYPEMGSKVDNINNKNMLSQTAANYTYIWSKGDNDWKETGVGITTWNNIWSYKDIAGTVVNVTASSPASQKIWRKHKSYVWNGTKNSDGIFQNYDRVTQSGDDKFDWNIGVGSQPLQWKQVSEVTFYDHFSSILEMKDINSNYSATKMGDKDSKITSVGNARYGEIFYSGAETNDGNWIDPEISVSNTSMLNPSIFHTGKQSVETTSTLKMTVSMKNNEHRAGKYKVSVWVEKSNAAKAAIKVDNATVPLVNDNVTAGNWQLKTAYIQLPFTAATIDFCSLDTSKVYFDDLMIRPVSSSISGYVYNEWDELTYIIGNNGLATKFEYDSAGRLIKTSVEVIDDPANGITTGGFKVVKTNMYNNRYLN